MKNLAPKLLAFQKEVGTIPKNEFNPFFKSKYADINAYIEVVKPILSKYGLVILQPLSMTENDSTLTTILIDSESGEQISHETGLPQNPDPQKMGAIITYFRRYAIQSMLCLEAEDNDGNGTTQSVKTPLAVKAASQVDNEMPFGGAEVCKDCGAEMVPGKNGKTYCKPCYIKWVNENKK